MDGDDFMLGRTIRIAGGLFFAAALAAPPAAQAGDWNFSISLGRGGHHYRHTPVYVGCEPPVVYRHYNAPRVHQPRFVGKRSYRSHARTPYYSSPGRRYYRSGHGRYYGRMHHRGRRLHERTYRRR